MTLKQLIDYGFDTSEHFNDHTHDDDQGYNKAGCSQCQVMVINGIPCHETGCPNQTHECQECMTQIKKGRRICDECENPEPLEEEPIEEDDGLWPVCPKCKSRHDNLLECNPY